MTLGDPTGVRIDITDVYAEVRQTHQEVRDLNAAMRPLVEGHVDHEHRIRELERKAVEPGDWTDHETRLRGLERHTWVTVGAAVACSAVASTVLSFILNHG